jgi:hypothetical protein
MECLTKSTPSSESLGFGFVFSGVEADACCPGAGRLHAFPKRDMAMAQSGLTRPHRLGKNDDHATASASAD